ncbi:MAG: proton-conducting transporter membrane subunit, partial [Pseudonocardia sp.]
GLAVLFAIPAMTLAGVPPTAGFVAKLALLQAGAGSSPAAQAVAGVVILASLLTLYALVRVWVRVFWGEPQPTRPDADPSDEDVVGTRRPSVPMYAATSGLIAASLAIAVFAGPLGGLTERAGVDLLDREPYRVAVLGAEEAR